MKKVLALVTALVLTLAMAVGASASVPDKPSEFAYAYDFDGSVLSSSTKTTIEQYGAALEEATGIQISSTVKTRRTMPRTSSTAGASASRAKTTAWSCCLRAVTAKSRSARAQALTA